MFTELLMENVTRVELVKAQKRGDGINRGHLCAYESTALRLVRADGQEFFVVGYTYLPTIMGNLYPNDTMKQSQQVRVYTAEQFHATYATN